VLDIGRLPGLAGVKRDNGHLTIGALTRHVDLERDKSWLFRSFPRRRTGSPTRWSETGERWLSGSICHADPSGDWGSVILALDAEVVAQSSTGQSVNRWPTSSRDRSRPA
jgi:carbon-monoxide dehydrogenase medium subunit